MRSHLSFVLVFSLLSSMCVANNEVPGVDPEKAVTWLKNGNERYLKRTQRSDGKSSADRQRLTRGQHPHTIVLSCSDSRVPPETVFDQALGEIFVIRVAGQALDASVLGSIEYAVEHLGTRLILVMGHTECGAVKAALSTPSGKSAGSPHLDKIVADIRPRFGARSPSSTPSKGVLKEVTQNASAITTELTERSSILKKMVSQGKLAIRSSVYHLDSGKVEFAE